MAWKFVLDDGREVALDALSPAVYDELAAKDDGASWWTVYQAPAASTARLWRLYEEACTLVGADSGPEPTTLADTVALLDRLERVEDVEELPMVDGYPTEADEPETSSSSGAPADSDGLPTLLADNESETC
jgi:hypothetical protein